MGKEVRDEVRSTLNDLLRSEGVDDYTAYMVALILATMILVGIASLAAAT